jgi:ABC-type glycerol-3-phosphate transport system substrate-binding protein
MMNALTFNGQRYALSIGNHIQPLALFFNKRLFREAGLDPELPYNMQKDKTWTWSNLLPIARRLTRDTTGDGIPDTWAFPRDPSTEFLDAVISSNGIGYVGRDANGRFYNTTGRPEFLEAMQYALQLSNEGLMLPQPPGAVWDWAYTAFSDGRVAMLVAPIWARDMLQGMSDDWGMVMFPMGPRVNDYVVFTLSHLLVIPSTFTTAQVQTIVSAVDGWFKPVDTSPYAWKDSLWHVFRDSRAVDETMEIVRDHRRSLVQYHRFISGLERGHIAWQMWYYEGDPAQLIESVTPSWNALINDMNGL